MTAYAAITAGSPCPACGWATTGSHRLDTNPRCPLHVQWWRLKPGPDAARAAAARAARNRDKAWLVAHPEAPTRTRRLSRDEQIHFWTMAGIAVEHIVVGRMQGYIDPKTLQRLPDWFVTVDLF